MTKNPSWESFLEIIHLSNLLESSCCQALGLLWEFHGVGGDSNVIFVTTKECQTTFEFQNSDVEGVPKTIYMCFESLDVFCLISQKQWFLEQNYIFNGQKKFS